MPIYTVGVRAVVEKNFTISAPDEDKAIELAHQVFTVASDGGNEHYEQETTYVELDPTGTVEYEYENED